MTGATPTAAAAQNNPTDRSTGETYLTARYEIRHSARLDDLPKCAASTGRDRPAPSRPRHFDPADLLHAIRVVAAGDALLSPATTQGLVGRFLSQPVPSALPAALELGRLTDREREVPALVAYGLSNDEMAQRLHLSPLTVKTHINRR